MLIGVLEYDSKLGILLIQEVKTQYHNMAMDEALLNFVSRGEIDPVIRFYTWICTLSIGYFQRLQKEIDIDKVKRKVFGLVRRQTRWPGRTPTHKIGQLTRDIRALLHPLIRLLQLHKRTQSDFTRIIRRI